MTKRASGKPISHAVALMLAELMHGPCNVTQLMEAGDCVLSTARLWVNALHEAGVVRVCGYEATSTGKMLVKLYEWNPEGKKDVRRPPKLTPAEKARRYRSNRRARRINLALAGQQKEAA